ncbi:MAG: hypothetical protein ACE5HL_02710 [Terriglobia bacterium]
MGRIEISFVVVSVLLALPTVTGAKTRISGTARCGRPNTQATVEVGDRPNHSFMVSQAKCRWVKPWEIEGIQNKKGVATAHDEIRGNSSRTRGFYVDTMANGDKVHYRYEGTATLKKGVPQSGETEWRIIRGTGKFKGIKGQGTCRGKAGADGSMTWECAGAYRFPK